MILVVYAHPYPRRSRACKALVEAIADLPGVEVRSLYDRYADFDVDADAERAALEKAELVVLLHPIYWYTTPGLLKHWFDLVLTKGWAFGPGGTKLKGKHCLWVATSGGDAESYTPHGRHHHEFGEFAPVVEQTMKYCGARWMKPLVVHGAHLIADDELAGHARHLRSRLERWHATRSDDA